MLLSKSIWISTRGWLIYFEIFLSRFKFSFVTLGATVLYSTFSYVIIVVAQYLHAATIRLVVIRRPPWLDGGENGQLYRENLQNAQIGPRQ